LRRTRLPHGKRWSRTLQKSALFASFAMGALFGCGKSGQSSATGEMGGQTGTGGAASTGNGGAAQGGSGGVAGGLGGDMPGSGGSDGVAGTSIDSGATSGGGGSAGDGGTNDASSDAATAPTVVEAIDVSDVWSGQPVFFSLITHGDQQFAAFYDATERMTVGVRSLSSNTWKLVVLPTTLGWDSHNYVAMAIDSGGFVHVSGNMHDVPLIYFRTTRPLDIDSFQQVPTMVETATETACTYPQFFADPAGALVFAYRFGQSGNGNYIFNRYNVPTSTWSRIINTPLLDGQGLYSAYPVGPILGPDGFYHLVWVWRDTPDAATNHDLSYAKSRDLVNWQAADGHALTLPITLAQGDRVDPVPAMGGMINNNTKIGFDAQNRPIVAYHKNDAAGNTQLFNARFENGRWVPHQTSQWTYHWAFGGTGTLVFVIQVFEPKLQPDGSLVQTWYHAQYGGFGAFQLDPTTLASTATIPPPLTYPRELDTPQSTTPGMVVRWQADTGSGPDPKVLYMLRWETLESNRDMPRTPIPPPTRLRLYAVRQP
jgi:hypothetical protein